MIVTQEMLAAAKAAGMEAFQKNANIDEFLARVYRAMSANVPLIARGGIPSGETLDYAKMYAKAQSAELASALNGCILALSGSHSESGKPWPEDQCRMCSACEAYRAGFRALAKL